MIFDKSYFWLTLALFGTEVLIAGYLHDTIIRPYGGDFLVVILVYCFIKTFFDTPVIKTAFAVLIFSYLIEVSQYFNLVNALGWGNSKFARLILGTSFSIIDLLTYTLGIASVIIIEKLINNGRSAKK
jgi:DNA integrity scanning protein DisA with diadenylate cyclase activity